MQGCWRPRLAIGTRSLLLCLIGQSKSQAIPDSKGRETDSIFYEELERHGVKNSDAGQSEEWGHFGNHILLIL